MALPLIPILLAGGLFMVASAGAKKRGVTRAGLPPEQAVRQVVDANPGGDPQQLALQAYHLAWPGCPLPEDFHPDDPDHMVCVSYLAQMLALVVAAQQGAPVGEEWDETPPPNGNGQPGGMGPLVRWPQTLAEIQAVFAEFQPLYDTRLGIIGIEYEEGNEAAVEQAVSVASAQYPEFWFFVYSRGLGLQATGNSAVDDDCPGAAAMVRGGASVVGPQDQETPVYCWTQGNLTDLVLEVAEAVRILFL